MVLKPYFKFILRQKNAEMRQHYGIFIPYVVVAKAILFYLYTNFKTIISNSPGTPKTPTNEALAIFMPREKPIAAKTVLNM